MTHPGGPAPRSDDTCNLGDPETIRSTDGGGCSAPIEEGLFDRARRAARHHLAASVQRANANAAKEYKDISTWPLYADAYRMGVRLAEDLGFRVTGKNFSAAMFAKATRSISSAAGNSSERLLAAIAHEFIKADGPLIAYLTADEFQSAIKDARAGILSREEVSATYRVSVDYVDELLTKKGSRYPPIRYPDSLSIYTGWPAFMTTASKHVVRVGETEHPLPTRTEVHVATEHKLSGALDSKSIETNLARLDEFRRRHRAGDDVSLLTAVAMPVATPTGSVLNRWMADATAYGVDVLCYNEGIYPVLFSAPEPSSDEYQRFVHELATFAAHGVVAYLTEGALTYDAEEGWQAPPETLGLDLGR